MTLAERFVEAARAADADAYRSLCSPDSRHWVNIGPVEHALDERAALLARERELLAEFDMTDVRVRDTDTGFVVQSNARGTLHSGETIAMALCAVVTCEGDRIIRVEEYVDSAAAAPLLRAVFTSP